MSSEELIDYCTELVTINGFPFNAFESSALQKIISPICKSLGIIINRQNIRQHIIKKAESYRKIIQEEIKDKMVSV